jgi:DNA-binding NarL/FixJ family response regulator
MGYKNGVSIGVSIVEDDRPVREILARWLSRAPGLRFVSDYGSAEAALARLTEDRPDVVLMDINLTGMSGTECVRRLKLVLTQTQFVMLTVYEDADHLFNALAAGASGYLLKQTPREELFAALKDVHAGGSPMSSNIARKVVQSFQRPPVADPDTEALTPREREVLELLARGDLYKEISEHLKISIPTVNSHIRKVYEKLHVRSRSQAVARFVQLPPRTVSAGAK